MLTTHFLKKFNQKLSKKITSISEDVKKIFMNYKWPGNIRELEHALEHAFILCRQNTITVDHLPQELRSFSVDKTSSLKSRKDNDRQEIIQALEKTAWNKAKAARLLGIDRKTIYRKIEKYKIAGN